jgi:hypothetical protein
LAQALDDDKPEAATPAAPGGTPPRAGANREDAGLQQPRREEPRREETRPQPAAPRAGAETGRGENDESLDAYMSQLFQRLGVKQSPTAPQSQSSGMPERVQVRNVETESAAPRQPAPAPAAPTTPLLAAEFKARSVAAERGSDLSAMRELANMNARAAVQTHQIKRASSTSKWKAVVAGISFTAACYGVFEYVRENPAGLYIAAAGVLVGAVFVAQYLGWKRTARKSARSLDDVLRSSTAKLQGEEPKA